MSLYKDLMDKIQIEEDVKESVKGLYSQVRENKGSVAKRVFKPAVSIALCITLIVLAGIGKDKLYEAFTGGDTSGKNSFTMMAEAAEMKKGVEIVEADGGGSMSSGDRGVCYSLSARFHCKGENVESITYRINKGIFQICGGRMEKSDIVLAGEEVEYSEETDIPCSGGLTGRYKEFTVAYDNQPQGAVRVEMAGRKKVKNVDALFRGSLEEQKRERDELLKGIVITCTVNYKDGSSESVDIKVKNKIMKYQDAYPGEKVAEPDAIRVFTTFELQ